MIPGRSRDEAEVWRIVVRIGDDDDADVFAQGHPVGALRSASGDRPRDPGGLGIDHLDRAVAVAHPYFGAALDDHDTIRSRGIAILQPSDEARYPRNEFVGLSIEDDNGFVGLVGEIAKTRRLVDGHNPDVGDRLTGY